MSQEINLINPALRPTRDWVAAKNVAIAAAVALSLMVLFHVYGRMSAAAALEAQAAAQSGVKALEQQVLDAQSALAARTPDKALENEIAGLAAAVKQRGEVLQLAESLTATSGGGVAEVMRGFSRQRMEGVWLTGFTFGPAGFDIRGRLLDPSLLPSYIHRLNAEPAFRGRTFAALDMQGVMPAPVVAPAGAAPATTPAAVPAPASGPLRYTEFFLRASLPAPTTSGSKE